MRGQVFHCVGASDQGLDRRAGQGFDYTGDSRADLEVWPHARRTILVNVSRTVECRLRLPAADIEVFSRR